MKKGLININEEDILTISLYIFLNNLVHILCNNLLKIIKSFYFSFYVRISNIFDNK